MNKTALFIDTDEWNRIVIENLNAFGYPLISIVREYPFVAQSLFKHLKLKENIAFCITDKMVNSTVFLVKYLISEYSKIIEDKNISFIVPTHNINGINLLIIGFLNQVFGLPGLSKNKQDSGIENLVT